MIYILIAVHKDGSEFVMGAYTKRERAYAPRNAQSAMFLGIRRFEVLELEVTE